MGDDKGPIDAAELARVRWPALLERLGGLGAELTRPPYPTGERAAVDGIRYLSRIVALGLQWCVEFGDPDFPAFYRHDDDVTKWGGPNVDNTYVRARVRGDAVYRLTGNGATTHGFVISTHEGDMHLEQYGVYAERWHDDLRREPNGDFTLTIGGPERTGNWMPLHPNTTNVTIRQYFDDWAQHIPGTFRIERVGAEGAPPPLDAAQLAGRLDDATAWIEASLRYWNRYIDAALERCGFNNIVAPGSVAGGSNGIAYGSGFADLGPREAMIIEGDAPDAWTWNFMLYNLGWFESLDFANRTTSLNRTQLHIDDDGRYRIVVAHEDPGVQNWLDTTGLSQAMVAYRFIRTTNSPVPHCTVVPIDAVRAALPATTPPFSAADRAAQIAVRQQHVARRFRN
ncbi:MAG: DUF1214 domain-containing protein [Actinobacteria bacterium]|uniref:Unannotated protein n=1 Tax=freshwater metagenome TaxID=449393 RepID=A0A6J6Z4W1_9ZZZZ|nr:DUF1214 domain-containing protein [Actinomycetota bacterium]MSX86064.1 DUF1214 domain-containing protein [Actinomycetota bacterium]MSY70467.1 DUF1214 domain-containing protein [Actinomycetota bacterium]